MKKKSTVAVSTLRHKFEIVLALIFLCLFYIPAQAENYLFFREAQFVAGYYNSTGKINYYSMSSHDVMQKSGIGFDYIQRIAGKQRDLGLIAVQARLAYSPESSPEFEVQLYNAYFKYKARTADLWIGHNRPAFGLSANLDNHALLLPSPAMFGYGFDRDWGLGLNREFNRGGISASLTSGSGMPLLLRGNYLLALRFSRGILEEQNFNYGFSVGYGQTLETMGYKLEMNQPVSARMIGFDLTYLFTRFENRFDFIIGEKADKPAMLLFWRSGINFLAENKLRLEIQPAYSVKSEDNNLLLFGGLSYQVNLSTTLRSMYRYDVDTADQSIVFQIYYYK